jgi:magnesium transporter
MATRSPFLPLLQRSIEHDPVTAAHLLETIEEAEAVAVLKALPAPLCAQVFPHLQVSHAAEFLKQVPTEVFEAIVKRIQPEQAATMLLTLPQDVRRTMLDSLQDGVKRKIQELLTYPENSAGRIMTTDVLAFHEQVKVKDAIQRIRQLASRGPQTTYAYVVDDENRLVGVLNMRDLLLAPSDATLAAIKHPDVFAVDGFLDREEVAHELSRRHFFAAPVVDAERHLLGVVKSDQLLGDVQEEATEDILRMVGAGVDERPFSPVPFSLRKRLPWLYVNLATAFLAAAVVGLFEDLIARITVLAVFLPVVAGQGGNAGAQSLAVVIRGMVLREIHPTNARRLILKETLLGLLNGVAVGLVTAAIVHLWHGNPFLGVVIGLAMIVNLTAAGLFGAVIPLALKALGLDPAQASSIFLTTVTDVVGFFSFLGFALLFQHLLL